MWNLTRGWERRLKSRSEWLKKVFVKVLFMVRLSLF